jgi:hypothetical protein
VFALRCCADDQDREKTVMGKLIYFVAYTIGAVSFYIAEHVSNGIAAARVRADARTPFVQGPPLAPTPTPDCTERLMLRLETIIMEMVSAARADDLETLHERAKVQLEIVRQLQAESTWPTEHIFAFLNERGRIDLEGADFQEMRGKVQQAECLHGRLAA